jgi:hypothetical protein
MSRFSAPTHQKQNASSRLISPELLKQRIKNKVLNGTICFRDTNGCRETQRTEKTKGTPLTQHPLLAATSVNLPPHAVQGLREGRVDIDWEAFQNRE